MIELINRIDFTELLIDLTNSQKMLSSPRTRSHFEGFLNNCGGNEFRVYPDGGYNHY